MRLSGSNGPTFDVQHDVSGNDGRGGVQDLFAGKRDTQLNRPSRERGGTRVALTASGTPGHDGRRWYHVMLAGSSAFYARENTRESIAMDLES